MSTERIIICKNPDDQKWYGNYFKWDGYPDSVMPSLRRDLLELGDKTAETWVATTKRRLADDSDGDAVCFDTAEGALQPKTVPRPDYVYTIEGMKITCFRVRNVLSSLPEQERNDLSYEEYRRRSSYYLEPVQEDTVSLETAKEPDAT